MDDTATGVDGVVAQPTVSVRNGNKPNAGEGEEGKADKDAETKPAPPQLVSFSKLFMYADSIDYLLMTLATIGAIGNGIAQPASFVVFGKLIQKFVQFGTTPGAFDISEDMKDFAIIYVMIGACMFVCSFLQAGFWSMTSIRQIHQIRINFFASILRQDIGWYDIEESGSLTTRLTDDLIKVQAGMGDKIGMAQQALAMFFGGFGIGFFYSWELTLVILAVTPALIIVGAVFGKIMGGMTSEEQDAYAAAGGIAEEAFSSIRTVVAFCGEQETIDRYTEKLKDAEKAGVKKAMLLGGSMGAFHIVMFGCYALAFWHGSQMVVDKKINAGELLIVFFCVMIGAAQLGQVGPSFEAISNGRGAAFKVFEIIGRSPTIDCLSDKGRKLENVSGNIEFTNVDFHYPSRPEIKILNKFDLKIEAGTTVALVGESGCGKSTCVKLVQRFYDVEDGSVSLDGNDLKSLNTKWLRNNIGVVSQEPVLFDMSIEDNIKFGAIHEANELEVVEAAKMANAHDFIMKLPNKYKTNVGEGGAQLSGGQKQRIAIARALIRNPKILLFDEATSALDTESEAIVQSALEKASKGRTTIIIAHRLSTVKNADKIVAVKDGKVAEQGRHKVLMEMKGVYHQLVLMQTMVEEAEEEVDENLTEEEREKAVKAKLLRSLSTLSDKSDEGKHLAESFSRQISSQHSLRHHKKESPSKHSHNEGEAKGKEEEYKPEPAPMGRIMKLNAPEWPYMAVGSFFAAIVGAFPVLFAFILSELIAVFAKPPEQIKEDSKLYALLFLCLGFLDFFGLFLSSSLFGKAGEVLTTRLRKNVFSALLRQDIAFYDDPKHGTGHLTARLATDASNVQGATCSRLNIMIQSIVMGITALTIAFYYSWKLTLLIVGFGPLLLFSGAAHMKVFTNFADEQSANLIDASAIATEAIMNIRTVASIGKEEYFVEKYGQRLRDPYKKSVRNSNIFGVTFGTSTSLMMLAQAAAFALGGKLVQDKELVFDDMFKVILSTVFGAMIAGQISSMAPNFIEAKVSAARCFDILDKVPEIDSYSTDGKKLDKVDGNIKFDEVSFNYPTRPDVSVLKSLTLDIKPGQKIALVGSSGCGKSTSIGLLERFYNPKGGQVSIDGNDISTLNVKWLRKQLGLVSQEPVLFARSIRDNIVYGLDRTVSEEEINKACQNANIHGFIMGLPKHYNTLVGDKGTLISGGQKQRIAIARALIRDPKIMLLDEATSALDSESEKNKKFSKPYTLFWDPILKKYLVIDPEVEKAPPLVASQIITELNNTMFNEPPSKPVCGISLSSAQLPVCRTNPSSTQLPPEPVCKTSPSSPQLPPEPVCMTSLLPPQLPAEPVFTTSSLSPQLPAGPVFATSPSSTQLPPEPVCKTSPSSPQLLPEPVCMTSLLPPQLPAEPVFATSSLSPQLPPEPVCKTSPSCPQLPPEPVCMTSLLPPQLPAEPVFATSSLSPQLPAGPLPPEPVCKTIIPAPQLKAESVCEKSSHKLSLNPGEITDKKTCMQKENCKAIPLPIVDSEMVPDSEDESDSEDKGMLVHFSTSTPQRKSAIELKREQNIAANDLMMEALGLFEVEQYTPVNDSGLEIDNSINVDDTISEIDDDQNQIEESEEETKREPRKTYKKPKRPCLFCGDPQSRLKRHILTKHKENPRVVQIRKLPGKEIDHAIGQLRREAILTQNKKVIEQGNTENIQREKKSTKCELELPVLCTGCHGFFSSSYKSRHQKLCAAGSKAMMMLPMPSLDQCLEVTENLSAGFAKLLNTLKLDEVSETIKKDEILIMIGTRYFNTLRKKKDKEIEATKYVRSRLRLSARVYLSFKNQIECQNVTLDSTFSRNLSDMFRRETITILGDAIDEICSKPDDESSITNQKSGLKISILNLIKVNAKYINGYYLMKNKDDNAKKVNEFLQVLRVFEDEMFGDALYDINYKKNVANKKPNTLPKNEDVKLLMEECIKVMSNIDVMDFANEYIDVRAATATYLIMFNARRGGEPVRLLISQWEEALQGEWTDESPNVEEDGVLVTFQTGKGRDHLVPVFFPTITHKALKYLCSQEVRDNANVSKENKYIFANTQQSQKYANGWHCLNEMLKKILKQGAFNATKNRHRVASILAKFNLNEQEKKLIYEHFGHSQRMNENVYQTAAGSRQIQSTGQMLLELAKNDSNQNCSTTDQQDPVPALEEPQSVPDVPYLDQQCVSEPVQQLPAKKYEQKKDRKRPKSSRLQRKVKQKKIDFGGLCDSDETDSSSNFEGDEEEEDEDEDEDNVGVVAAPPKKIFKNMRWNKAMKSDFMATFGAVVKASEGKYPDRKKMESFALKYGLNWTQVKTRIMNERKFFKKDVEANLSKMGMT